jgi:hypothetical protein
MMDAAGFPGWRPTRWRHVAACRRHVAERRTGKDAPGAQVTGVFLPGGGTPETKLELLPEQAALKLRSLDCFVAHRTGLARFPANPERPRPAPDCGLAVSPPPGRLLYEGGVSRLPSGPRFPPRAAART